MRLIKQRSFGFMMLSCLLTGCGSYSNQFDCPIGPGLKCASLSEVNDQIDAGHVPLASQTKNCPGCQRVYWQGDLIDKGN